MMTGMARIRSESKLVDEIAGDDENFGRKTLSGLKRTMKPSKNFESQSDTLTIWGRIPVFNNFLSKSSDELFILMNDSHE